MNIIIRKQKLLYKLRCKKKLNESIAAVLISKTKVELTKPIYVIQAILDLSTCKPLMYRFFYDDIRKWYPDARMFYTDTASFALLIKTKDFYKDMPLDQYDTSNYIKDHP